jgi:hypothetical protein
MFLKKQKIIFFILIALFAPISFSQVTGGDEAEDFCLALSASENGSDITVLSNNGTICQKDVLRNSLNLLHGDIGGLGDVPFLDNAEPPSPEFQKIREDFKFPVMLDSIIESLKYFLLAIASVGLFKSLILFKTDSASRGEVNARNLGGSLFLLLAAILILSPGTYWDKTIVKTFQINSIAFANRMVSTVLSNLQAEMENIKIDKPLIAVNSHVNMNNAIVMGVSQVRTDRQIKMSNQANFKRATALFSPVNPQFVAYVHDKCMGFNANPIVDSKIVSNDIGFTWPKFEYIERVVGHEMKNTTDKCFGDFGITVADNEKGTANFNFYVDEDIVGYPSGSVGSITYNYRDPKMFDSLMSAGSEELGFDANFVEKIENLLVKVSAREASKDSSYFSSNFLNDADSYVNPAISAGRHIDLLTDVPQSAIDSLADKMVADISPLVADLGVDLMAARLDLISSMLINYKNVLLGATSSDINKAEEKKSGGRRGAAPIKSVAISPSPTGFDAIYNELVMKASEKLEMASCEGNDAVFNAIDQMNALIKEPMMVGSGLFSSMSNPVPETRTWMKFQEDFQVPFQCIGFVEGASDSTDNLLEFKGYRDSSEKTKILDEFKGYYYKLLAYNYIVEGSRLEAYKRLAVNDDQLFTSKKREMGVIGLIQAMLQLDDYVDLANKNATQGNSIEISPTMSLADIDESYLVVKKALIKQSRSNASNSDNFYLTDFSNDLLKSELKSLAPVISGTKSVGTEEGLTEVDGSSLGVSEGITETEGKLLGPTEGDSDG